MCKFLITSLFAFIISIGLIGQEDYYVSYNDGIRCIYKDILQLDFVQAKHNIDELKVKEPYNLALLHVENYLDFFQLFISEDSEAFKNLKRNKNLRIKEIKKRLRDDNAYKNYLLAEINLQWALIRSKFGEYIKAGHEIYSAYNYLIYHEEKFAGFGHHKKSLSCILALIESLDLPGFVKSIFQLNSSIQRAESEISSYIQNDDPELDIFRLEAKVIQNYIVNYLNLDPKRSRKLLEDWTDETIDSPLLIFCAAQLAQQIGDNELALTYLSKVNIESKIVQFPYLEFMTGVCKLRKSDSSAQMHFKSFITHFKGQHYIKEAYQKMAWCSLLFDNDTSVYLRTMAKASLNGNAIVDSDIDAANEASSPTIPNITLLKCRLLFDGGYYKEALKILNIFKSDNEHLMHEALYRKARILQQLEEYPESIECYDQLLEKPLSDDYIYCNGHLQLGIIYEKQHQVGNAERHYNLCLRMNPTSYKRSLHQKARAGIDRLEKW